jgi:hypothetical protein
LQASTRNRVKGTFHQGEAGLPLDLSFAISKICCPRIHIVPQLNFPAALTVVRQTFLCNEADLLDSKTRATPQPSQDSSSEQLGYFGVRNTKMIFQYSFQIKITLYLAKPLT